MIPDSHPDLHPPLISPVLAWVLRGGTGAAGAAILGGLVSGVDRAADVGILVLLATPVLVLAVALVLYVRAKDWWMACTCITVGAVLGATVLLGL